MSNNYKTIVMVPKKMKEDLMIRYSQALISELRMCVADKKSITNIMNEKMKAGEERDKANKESK